MTRQTVKSTETAKTVGLHWLQMVDCINSTLPSVSMQHWPYSKLIGQQVAMVAPWYKSVTYFGSVSMRFIQPRAFGV